MAVTFNKPPLEEVIVGAYFAQPIPLRSEHVGLFWSEVRKELPVIQQQAELPPPFGPTQAFGLSGPGELYPMPRFFAGFGGRIDFGADSEKRILVELEKEKR